MSIQRWDVDMHGSMFESDDGPLVFHADHVAAVAAARDDVAGKRLLAIIFHSPDTGPKAFALVREHDVSGV